MLQPQVSRRQLRPRFMVTGHSLGGALAHLAALDIQRELDLGPDQV